MKKSFLALALLMVPSALFASSRSLTRVCAFAFETPSELISCKKLADGYASVAELDQRMYQPNSAAWDPNQPVFVTPSVYWVQNYPNAEQRQKGASLDPKQQALAKKAKWSSCFDAVIVDGALTAGRITVGTVNNYFPYDGKFGDALDIRVKVSALMRAADAGPPVVIRAVDPMSTVIGFLAFYEAKDAAQAAIFRQRQYQPQIIKEVDKIDPFLQGFARMRSAIVYDKVRDQSSPK